MDSTKKYLVNASGVRDGLSGDMLASSRRYLVYYTFNKFHLNSFNLLVISNVTNFRYVANFRFLTLISFVIDSNHMMNMDTLKILNFGKYRLP